MEQQHAESFQPETHPVEKRKPEEQKDNVILFPQKEKEQSYEKYKASGGILSPEEYRDVLERFADEREAPATSLSSAHANSMARAAGITLTPEAVSIYGKLRAEQPDTAKEEMSDQKLLAETLLIIGDKSSWTAFTEKYPHIFH
jgi:hypothetical protein